MWWERCSRLISQRVALPLHQSVAHRSKRLVDQGNKTRGKLPVPPTEPTVSYIPLPERLDPVKYGYQGERIPGRKALRFFDHRMQRDARRREVVDFYAPLRTRLNCIRKCKFLPEELRNMADEEISNLPRDSCVSRLVPRCIHTSRPRGNKVRWRISRMRFRELADHSKLSGMTWARWKNSFE